MELGRFLFAQVNRDEHGELGGIFMQVSVSFLLTIKFVTRLRRGQ